MLRKKVVACFRDRRPERTGMQRKKDAAVSRLNGYGPEKGLRRDHVFEVNGYAPEKSRFNSQFVHLFILFTGERTSNHGIFMPCRSLEDPSESERVWGGLRTIVLLITILNFRKFCL